MRRKDVKETYDRIAPHFARTRPNPWSEVESFLRCREGSVGLDIGVGNGRHSELMAPVCHFVVGLDLSRAALGEAATRAADRCFDLALVEGEATSLPLFDDSVDLAVYVATLHHLPSRELRIASLEELARVLDPSAQALVSVWSVTHERFTADVGFDTVVDWTLPDGEVVGRFYHIYDGDEFASDLDSSGLVRTSTFESGGNWYAIVEPA